MNNSVLELTSHDITAKLFTTVFAKRAAVICSSKNDPFYGVQVQNACFRQQQSNPWTRAIGDLSGATAWSHYTSQTNCCRTTGGTGAAVHPVEVTRMHARGAAAGHLHARRTHVPRTGAPVPLPVGLPVPLRHAFPLHPPRQPAQHCLSALGQLLPK